MDNRCTDIVAVKSTSLIRPDLRETKTVAHFEGLTIRRAIADYIFQLKAMGHTELVVQVNGYDVPDLDVMLKPGDFVSVTPKHGFDPIQALIWTALWYAGAYAAINTVSAIITTALIVGGGLLVGNLFTPSAPNSGAQNDSPTYGWNAVNPTRGGNPIQVVYGNVQTVPQILGSYRRISDDYNMWVYLLLGLAAHETNNAVTAGDVFVGDEPLSNYTEYYFGVTSGAVNPSAGDEALLADKFAYTYHDRTLDRQLKYSEFNEVSVAAQGTLTGYGAPVEDDIVQVAGETYTFKTSRTQDHEVAIGDLGTSLANLAAAITSDSTVVSATHPTGSTVLVTADTPGSAGNSLPFAASWATPENVSVDGGGYLGGTTLGVDGTDPDAVFHLSTNGQVDYVVLMITFPYGKFQIDDGGSFLSYDVEMEYGYRKVGDAGAITWASQTLGGKGTQAIRKEIWITLPTRDRYDIYLNRNTEDDPEDESKQRSQSFLTSMTEMVQIFQSYPGIQCAVVGLKASDRLSGQLPAIKVVQNRTVAAVPNWNGVGTQNVNVTNHGWALYDALTNPSYGRDEDPAKIIYAPWAEWIQYLDGTVGGYTRAKFNTVFDALGTVSDLITAIEQSGRCKILKCGDDWSVAVDKPKTLPSYTFSRGNIVKDSWSWEGFEDAEKVDAVVIKYRDKDRGWREKSTPPAKATWYDSLTKVPKIATIEIRSINNREQAVRESILRIQKNEQITRRGSLKTVQFRGADLQLLDWVDIVHRSIPFGFSGCLAGVHGSAWPEGAVPGVDGFDPNNYTEASTLYLDQVINMPSADYDGKASVMVIANTGTRYEYEVTGPFDVDTTSITIDGQFTGRRWDVWAIGRPDDDKLAYQIVSKKLNNRQQCEFEVVEYGPYVFFNGNYESGEVEI